jgi:hypothetical protein
VPNFAKVSTVQFSVLGRKKRSYERIYLQHWTQVITNVSKAN